VTVPLGNFSIRPGSSHSHRLSRAPDRLMIHANQVAVSKTVAF